MSQAWMKFFPSDWCGDRALRGCSLGARGLWMEMLAVMNESDPRGSLLINGRQIDVARLSSIVGAERKEVARLFRELEDAGVFSRDEDGTVFSRRMRRDDEKAKRDRENGKGGGNPNITNSVKRGVNPPIKAQIPEATVSEANASGGKPPDPDAELFKRGKEILGPSAGGQISKIKGLFGGDVTKARAFFEEASTKENPGEYVAGTIRKNAGKPQQDQKAGIHGALRNIRENLAALGDPTPERSGNQLLLARESG